jgi:hypothetical protein
MRKSLFLFLIPAFFAMPSAAAAGELKLTIQNGLVTLIADEVPLSMIMAEWARVGQTKIVNGDKITTPVSLHIVDTPERKALDILLRTASGYMAAERPAAIASASMFDRIMILPTSRAPLNTGPAPSAQPTFNLPRPIQAPPVPDMDDDEPMVRPPMGQPQPGMNPNQPMLPGQQTPNAPLTAPRPGPLPQPTPQQPVPFGAPKPPGGGGPGGGPGGVPPGGGA